MAALLAWLSKQRAAGVAVQPQHVCCPCCSSQRAPVRPACMHAMRDGGPNSTQVASSESQKEFVLQHTLEQHTGTNEGPCAAVARAQSHRGMPRD